MHRKYEHFFRSGTSDTNWSLIFSESARSVIKKAIKSKQKYFIILLKSVDWKRAFEDQIWTKRNKTNISPDKCSLCKADSPRSYSSSGPITVMSTFCKILKKIVPYKYM